jgi:lipopolysaccharide cholinephosphotransferase
MINLELEKDFGDEEVVSGYRISRELKQVWEINIDLLDVFQRFCKKHSLRFFIGFGTLLGAFRHQGFIPWDDDIDILMPREDFERLKNLSAEISTYPYFLQSSCNDSDFWYRGMMKFRNSNTACIEKRSFYKSFNQGIALEILPLDKCPDQEHDRRNMEKKIGLFQKLIWAKVYGQDYKNEGEVKKRDIPRWKWQVYCFIATLYSKNYLENKLWKLCTCCQTIKTQYYSLYTSYSNHNLYPVFKADDFSDVVEMTFENLSLPAPNGFWHHLEQQYGKDFLSYLSLEQRKPHHPAFWAVDESYKVYQKRFQDIFKDTENKIIVLFGTGNMVLDYERKTKGRYKPDFYVDNDQSKWEKERNGISIKSPKSLLNVPKDKLHLIICNNYFREIGQQLRDMGIDEYYIYVEDFSSLFSSPNEIGFWRQNRLKPYHIGYIEENFSGLGIQYINFLAEAKKKCDYLIVGIFDSDLTREERVHRRKLVKAIEYVDRVVENPEADLIEEMKKSYSDCLFLIERNTMDNEKLEKLNKMGVRVEYIM